MGKWTVKTLQKDGENGLWVDEKMWDKKIKGTRRSDIGKTEQTGRTNRDGYKLMKKC